ncbi:MAG: ABC-2 type transport system permease protein [Planctomycetota bacterium]|jgi:ABC-2 type transport system permease protein
MRWRVVQQVARTAFVEFWRTPAAVFWTYGFPLVMAVVLGFAFQPGTPPPVPVAIVDVPGASQVYATMQATERLSVELLPADLADQALARGRVALLIKIDEDGPVLRSDPTRPEAELAQLLVERALSDARGGGIDTVRAEIEDRPGSRYIDFLIPGLIGLNLLGAGMWGVGFNLVQMRVQNLLRRLFVTPMRRSEFLAGYLLGRSILVIPEAIAIMLFGVLLWGVPFRGSYLAAFLVILIGGWTFTGIGCLCASRARTIETIGGLMNAVQLPMWILGGTFFANEALEGPVRWIAECMPLTHVNRSLREVMLESGTLLDIWLPLTVLLAAGAIAFGLAMRLFRWQ